MKIEKKGYDAIEDRRKTKCEKYQPQGGMDSGPCTNCGRNWRDHFNVRRAEDRPKSNYLGAPACFHLELAARQLREAFDGLEVYQVGSSLLSTTWRDVDVRGMLDDDAFATLFPDAGEHWEFDARWLLLSTIISGWLRERTDLPIDFQFQPRTHANERHGNKSRNPLGIRIARNRE